MSDNSATEELFNEAAQPYQAELDRCGYSHKLKFPPENKNKKRIPTKKHLLGLTHLIAQLGELVH